MTCLISIPVLPIICHFNIFLGALEKNDHMLIFRKMTPDEADTVVIGVSCPENLPTIGRSPSLSTNLPSVYLTITTACKSEGLVAWRLNKPLIDSCAAAISLNHLNILKRISA
ncbi:unnamed protein product [Musa hybrid cultivar]